MKNDSLRDFVKGLAQIVFGLIAIGLLAEGATNPENGWYTLVMVVAGITWAVLHARDRDEGRLD